MQTLFSGFGQPATFMAFAAVVMSKVLPVAKPTPILLPVGSYTFVWGVNAVFASRCVRWVWMQCPSVNHLYLPNAAE